MPSKPALSAERTAICRRLNLLEALSGCLKPASTAVSGRYCCGGVSMGATISAFGLAICTWICGVRHCGQNGRPSSTGVPHCEQACSTYLKLAQSEEHGKNIAVIGPSDHRVILKLNPWSDRDSFAMIRSPDGPMPFRWCHPCRCGCAHKPARGASHGCWISPKRCADFPRFLP